MIKVLTRPYSWHSWLVVLTISLSACTSFFHQPGSELDHIYSRTFLADYNTAWQATLEATRNFEKTNQNRNAGVLQTYWIDNTAAKNFTDSFGGDATYLKTKYRLNISLANTKVRGQTAVKVSILKNQLLQRDLLEGWKAVESDSVEENAILYRIGRIISIKKKLAQIEDEKVKRAVEEATKK